MTLALSDIKSSGGCDITLTDLCYQVDNTPILNGISVQTAAARIGVVGRNGSGKSTLARIIAGLVVPTSGIANIGGHDLAKDRRAALTHVGILFQNPDHQIIFPTVREEICFGLRQLGHCKTDADRMAQDTLADFGKSHWIDAAIHSLSQGQKHLLCLMAIVAMTPKMIILDEPFTGLDIPTRAQLTRYLSRYQGSLLHISHDPADLSGYDDVIWLEQGKIAKSGAAAQVLHAYQTHMTAAGGSDDISVLAR